jgi:hypothetical protein
MREVEDGLHRRLMAYAGQELPAYLQTDKLPTHDPPRNPLEPDLSLPDVHRIISPLNMNRTRPALPTAGTGSYVGQFQSTTALLEHTLPWANPQATNLATVHYPLPLQQSPSAARIALAPSGEPR